MHFKRILNFLATIPPGEFSVNNLAKNLQIDYKTAHFYLEILSEIAIGDYSVEKRYFEIGGKNKNCRQLKDKQNAFVVKDGILHPSHNTLPLYLLLRGHSKPWGAMEI